MQMRYHVVLMVYGAKEILRGYTIQMTSHVDLYGKPYKRYRYIA